MMNPTIGNPFHAHVPAQRRALAGLIRVLRSAYPQQPARPHHVPKYIWDRHSALLVSASRSAPRAQGVWS
jgi:hypothetical protein